MDLKLKDNSQLTLPIGHFPVEYIESTGYPTIKFGTDFSFHPLTLKIDTVLEVISNTVAGSTIYGCSYTNGPFFYLKCRDAGDNTTFIACASKQNTSVADTVIEFSGKTHIIHSKGYLKVNNTEYTLSASNRAVSANCYLLSSGSATVRIYSFKAYYGNAILLRDFIPAISYQEGHIGESCLYDKVHNQYFYSTSTGTFTASPSQGLYDIITSAYVKDCPNVSGINILRSCINLNRVRLDVGTQSGTVAELYKYAAYAGFNDAYENQTKPRLVGTWTITDYWTNDELAYLQSAFDGLTISYDSSKNVETLLENGDMAVQTLDSTKPNYNPAAAIVLQGAGYGRTLDNPIVEGETGKWFLSKAVASTITSISTIFRNAVDVVDANGIVSDDTTLEYSFTSFNELQYFGITSIAAGSSTSALGSFGGCTKLERIILPETVTTIGAYGFYNCNKLESINIPRGLTANISDYAFYNCKSIINFDSPRGAKISAFRGTSSATTTYQFGCGTGIFIMHGGLGTTSLYATRMYFKKILATSFTWNVSNALTVLANTIVRISGTITDSTSKSTPGFTNGVVFLECNALSLSSAANNRLFASGGTQEVFIRRADLLPSGTPDNFGSGTVSKFYVGLGKNESDDNATLQLYLNDANWGTVSAKLDTWYNYNGQYKWYYVTANLSNCTSTNPDAWPHITRG